MDIISIFKNAMYYFDLDISDYTNYYFLRVLMEKYSQI